MHAHAHSQANVIQKDAVLQQIAEQKGGIESQLGVPVKDRQAGESQLCLFCRF